MMKELIDLGVALSSNDNTYTHPLFISRMGYHQGFIQTKEFTESVLNSRNPSIYFDFLHNLGISLTGSFGEILKLRPTPSWDIVAHVIDHSRKRFFACPRGVYFTILLCLKFKGNLPENETPFLARDLLKFQKISNFFNLVESDEKNHPYKIQEELNDLGLDTYEGLIVFEVSEFFKKGASSRMTNKLSSRSSELLNYSLSIGDEDLD